MKTTFTPPAPKNELILLENGYEHSTDLTPEEAEEMLERHSRIFPDIDWSIAELPRNRHA